MSEPQLAFLLCAAWTGAMLSYPVPVWLGLLAVAGAMAMRRPVGLVAAVFVLSLAVSAHANRQYVPSPTRAVDESIQLVTDPEPAAFGWRAEGRLGDSSRVRLNTSLDVDLGRYTAGDTLWVEGQLRPIVDVPWLRVRHVVGSVSVANARFVAGAPWWMEPSNQIRAWVGESAEPFSNDSAALYTGLVVGDDRYQSESQQALFRSGGLTHLLAVSGQNVAFALAVAGPALSRLGVRWRLGATLLVLAVFAVATRFEPSVLRATVTAGIAAWAVHSGTPASGIRALFLAVTALILIDPFLVDSVGFQLSVGASLAILILAPLLADRLRGPRFVMQPLAVTLAAQAGVAPIMLATFGPVSASSIPANMLAGPAAGGVMTWGLSGGIVAAWLPESAAVVMQWPVGLLVRWIGGVAGWATRLPLPTIGPSLAVGLGLGLIVIWVSVGLGPRVGLLLRSGVALVLVGVSLVAVPAPPVGETSYDSVTLYPSVDGSLSVLVVDGAPSPAVLEALIGDRVRSVDVVVTVRGGYTARTFIAQLVATIGVGSVLAPPLHQIRGARVVDAVVELRVVGGVLVVGPDTDRTRLTVGLEAVG